MNLLCAMFMIFGLSTINDCSKESLLLVYASDEGAYQSAQLRSLMSLVLPAFKNGNPEDELSCKGAQ